MHVRKWENEEIIFLKDNYFNMSVTDISKILGRSEGAVRSQCNKIGLVKHDRWDDEEIKYLKQHLYDMTYEEIADSLNRSPSSVSIKANKIGFKKYPYHCDYDFFQSIDTEVKAYWLGFISADGWVSSNEKTGSGAVGIELQYNDIGHLKKFNKCINGNYQITDRYKKCAISTKKDTVSHTCCIRIFSKTMVSDLNNLGITSNKTYDLIMPELPTELVRHYLRGFFDGDGCFGISFIKNEDYSNSDIIRKCSCSYLGASKNMITQIRDILNSNNIGTYLLSTHSDNYSDMWRVYVNENKANVIKFLDYIYKDSSIYLDRKYEKYLFVKRQLTI